MEQLQYILIYEKASAIPEDIPACQRWKLEQVMKHALQNAGI